jgi:hypothetical protein
MKPLRAFLLLGANEPPPSEPELCSLDENGWSVTVHEWPHKGSVSELFDELTPQLVHMRGSMPLSALFHARIRGLPILLESRISLGKISHKLLATVTVAQGSAEQFPAPRLHYLYLVTLNMAFSPPPIREQTLESLSRTLRPSDVVA